MPGADVHAGQRPEGRTPAPANGHIAAPALEHNFDPPQVGQRLGLLAVHPVVERQQGGHLIQAEPQALCRLVTALGFGCALTSGKALRAARLRRLFELTPDDQALCFISIGTVLARKPARPRPSPSAYVRTLPTASS